MSVTNEDRSAISREELLQPMMNENSLQNIMIKEEEQTLETLPDQAPVTADGAKNYA